MRRLEDWTRRLAEYIEAARGKPFAWGSHDCATFAFDWVRRATGSDPVSELWGTYDSEFGAGRILAPHGGIEGFATARLGERCPAAQAQRGDIVAVATESGPALGVCVGVRAAFVSPQGLAFLPLDKCEGAWRV